MENKVIVIDTEIDTKDIIESLIANRKDWDATSKLDRQRITGLNDDFSFIPLIKPKNSKNEFIQDVERQVETEFFKNYYSVKELWKKYNVKKPARTSFYKLAIKKYIDIHQDRGKYYFNKDSYYLTIQSNIHFYIGDTALRIQPGTFFWVGGGLPYGVMNIDRDESIFLKFDAYPNKNNPHHNIV